jgi:hypothetical protein
MSSSAQVLANQANALLSTGPKTEEGKKKSSLNAWRHGLTGQTVVMPHEDMQSYLAFRKDLEARLQPADALESQIAGRMIDIQWRLNRCFSMEMAVYALGHSESPATADQIDTVTTAARVLHDKKSTIQVLGMHEQRLTRMYKNAKADLESLQAARKNHDLQQLIEASSIRNLKQTLKQPWDPAENGFDLSLPEIDRYLNRQKNLDNAARAWHKGSLHESRLF